MRLSHLRLSYIQLTNRERRQSWERGLISDTVSGSIITDGTIGFLQTGNVLDYNLYLIDNLDLTQSVTLTPSNSKIYGNSVNGLSPSASGLSFNFSQAGALFLIQGNEHGYGSGYQYFCFQATSGPCAAGETIVPNYYQTDGVVVTSLIGTVPLGAVPEPASWAMMIGGIGFVGGAMRRRTTKVAFA